MIFELSIEQLFGMLTDELPEFGILPSRDIKSVPTGRDFEYFLPRERL